ncbi:MAG: S8 family peptidase [Muribaculaceae bacterium]
MKKIYSNILSFASSIMRPTISLALLLAATGATAQSKISPSGQIYMQKAEIEKANLSPMSANEQPEIIKALVTLSNGATAEDLTDCTIDCTIGDKFVIVDLPLDKVNDLAELDAVSYISFGTTCEAYLDFANEASYTNEVHAGSEGLPKAYNGEGVIAGIIDSGFDPNHAAFLAEDGTTSRVKLLHNFFNGQTYTETDIPSFTTDIQNVTHGTGVAGAFAGRGRQNGKYGKFDENQDFSTLFTKGSVVTGEIPFEAPAYKSDIALVSFKFDAETMLSGCNKILEYSKSAGKPAVINISYGNTLGRHDATDPENQALDIIAQQIPVFVAAGNQGNTKKSLEETFNSSKNDLLTTFLNPDDSSINKEMQFWADNDNDLEFGLVFVDFNTMEVVGEEIIVEGDMTLAGSKYTHPDYTHNDAFDTAYSPDSYIIIKKGIDASNNCSYITVSVNVTSNTTTNADNKIKPYFAVMGYNIPGTRIIGTTNGEFSSLGYQGFIEGNGDASINNWACANNVIAVGAYNTHLKWYTLSDAVYGFNESTVGGGWLDVAPSSSYGTTLDGRKLPHIIAPGYGMISACNQYYYDSQLSPSGKADIYSCGYTNANGRDNYWTVGYGTSYSAPYAAGVAALLLQARPDLSPLDIRDILTKTADNSFIENTYGKEIQWGAGKVNTLAAIKMALEYTGVGEVFENEDLRLLVTPNGGKNYNVFVAGVDHFNATLYNISGAAVKSATFEGNEGNLDASDLTSGIYVLEVKADNAHLTQKIVIK